MSLLVVGGGIVGLATAYRFSERFPSRRVIVLEKEKTLGSHQSGRNSGVLHSGIYYHPESLKASNCRRGKRMMEEFCAEEKIPFERCGKVVVAVDESELPRLDAIRERAEANGVACERIGPERLKELEPHAAGLAALHVPETGIVDYRAVCARLADKLQERGAKIVTGARVTALLPRTSDVTVSTKAGEFGAQVAVNCGGLHADRVLQRAGCVRPFRIVPFRGEYHELVPEARGLVKNLIYPVPDPRLPFLGVHFTRRIGGAIECGPNAVLAFAREGYRMTSVSLGDLWDTLTYDGFWRLARKHGRVGAAEIRRSLFKSAFARALQRLVPEVRASHLVSRPAGVRAQALDPDGSLVDDFRIEMQGRLVHVLNAPSPAATASFSIGEAIVDRLAPHVG